MLHKNVAKSIIEQKQFLLQLLFDLLSPLVHNIAVPFFYYFPPFEVLKEIVVPNDLEVASG